MSVDNITRELSADKKTTDNTHHGLSRKVLFEMNTFSPEELEDEKIKKSIEEKLYLQIDATAGDYKGIRMNVGVARDLYSTNTRKRLLGLAEKYETIANDLKYHASMLSTGMQLTLNILLLDAVINEFRNEKGPDPIPYHPRNALFLMQKATGRLNDYAENGDGERAKQLHSVITSYVENGYLSDTSIAATYPECEEEWVDSTRDAHKNLVVKE